MITTDWAQAVLRYLFKGKITAEEDAIMESVVNVQFPTAIGRNLLGINYEGAKPKWWIEDSSDKIHSRGKGIVELISSDELRRNHGSKYIAIGFQQGKGEVFHFVSHLIAQKFEEREERDSQNLDKFLELTNTVVTEKSRKKAGEYSSLGGIETTYTLMNTVLELVREKPILKIGRRD
jgi:hypothetical protein